MLTNQTVLLAVTGSIAAYKIADLARKLKKLHADVHVLMTQNATNFINPITFETLTGNKCLIDTFDRNFQFSVEHVALARKANLVLVAPASANVIGKIANGIADDMLTTTIMACSCPVIISPAMNHYMFHHPILQDNLAKLEKFHFEIIPPEKGMLANGDTGDGRMPETSVLLAYILKTIAHEHDFSGKKILITAGATQEAIDPVRFITNHSTGKMGFALAEAAVQRGAEVTLIAGHTEISPPLFVNFIRVTSAEEMFHAVTEHSAEFDIIIKAAAVADYTPMNHSSQKMKKSDGNLQIPLKRTQDILQFLGEHKPEKQFLCGFSMETENLLEHSRKKLFSKHCDMICANSLTTEGSGFGTDTNILTLITARETVTLPKLSKEQAAHQILDHIRKQIQPLP